jgi:hypothetical protein
MSSKLESRGSRRERGRRSGRGCGRDGRGVDVDVGVGVAVVGQVQFRRRPRRAAPLSVPESARSRLAQPRVGAEFASLVEGVARDARGGQQLHGADAAVTLSSQTAADGDNGQRAENEMSKLAERWARWAAGPAASRGPRLTARPMADVRRAERRGRGQRIERSELRGHTAGRRASQPNRLAFMSWPGLGGWHRVSLSPTATRPHSRSLPRGRRMEMFERNVAADPWVRSIKTTARHDFSAGPARLGPRDAHRTRGQLT